MDPRCDEDHEICQRHDYSQEQGTKTQTPTRIIEIGQTLRLVNSASLAEPTRYVALSYC
jgi:hypothetical protein